MQSFACPPQMDPAQKQSGRQFSSHTDEVMTTGRINIVHHGVLSPSFVMCRKEGEKQESHTRLFYLLRGRVFYTFSQYEKAARDFRTALRMDWRHEEAAVWLDKAERAARSSVDGGNAKN